MTSRLLSALGVAIGLTAALVAAPAAPASSGSSILAQFDTALRATDSLVQEWVDAERIPGAVLLVARNGEVAFERAYGWAQLYDYRDGQYGASAAGDRRPRALRRLQDPPKMTSGTVFDLASVTKVMATTFAVMLLVDEGELELDLPVRTYLPDFGDANAKRNITVRHLLTHRSGLHQWKPVYYHADSADRAYEYIRDLPLAWGVGTERHYSDLGFMLLGLVVERTAGRPLEEFLQDRLYGPLGLSSTGFRSASPGSGAGTPVSPTPAPAPTAPDVDRAFAATSHGNPYERRMVHDPDFGYRIEGDPNTWEGWRRNTLVGEVNDGNAFHAFDGTAGHAGLFSNAADLQVLLQLMLNRGELGGRRYISADVVDSFLATSGEAQALGWQVPADTPAGSFGHSGFTGTYVLGVPTRDLAVILLTNRQNLGVGDSGRYPDVGELQEALTRELTR